MPQKRVRTSRAAAAASLLVGLLAAPFSQAALTQRWSFTTPAGTAPAGTSFVDSVGGTTALVRGNGATLDGSALTLPGSTNGDQPSATVSAYLDLPNGLISSRTHLTVEIWATPLSSRPWQRLFDFGSTAGAGDGLGATGEWTGQLTTAPGVLTASDEFALTLNVAASMNTHRLYGRLNNGSPGGFNLYVESNLATTAGQRYHYVVTFEDGVGTYGVSGGRETWYRDGALIATLDVPWRLSQLDDVNNWIGRSQFTADNLSHAAFHEIRLHNHALSLAEIAASLAAGPDSLPAPPPPPPAAPVPTHRWSFTRAAGAVPVSTSYLDVTGRLEAIVRGNGATSTGTALTLPGTTNGDQTATAISAYLDLPNGLISSRPSLTLEAWVTPLSSKNWQRLFDFGNTTVTSGTGAATGEVIDGPAAPGGYVANDNVFLSLNVGGVLGTHRLAGKLDAGAETGGNTDLSSSTTAGTQYHHALVVEDRTGSFGNTGCRVSWYRDGVLRASTDLPFRLPDVSDVNNWIGRSMWAADSGSHLTLNELRLHERALSAAEVLASSQAGPDAALAAPTPQPDTALLHPGQKVLLDVLANDGNTPIADSLAISVPPTAGTALVRNGRILYTHDGSSTSPVTFSYSVANASAQTAVAQVTLTLADSLRISNPALTMPAAPPATVFRLVDALPGVTFSEPIAITPQPGNNRRLYVCERLAKIQLVPDVTAATPEKRLFLDLQTAIAGRTPAETIENGANYENGLLGLAFHPSYSTNGYFYVAYTVRISGVDYQRISRFRVSAGNPDIADPTSELVLLQQLDEGDNHNGGDLHFGPDGYLYYAAGDEENPNDFRQNSQRLDKDFHAGIFRIDVDKRPGNLAPTPHAAIPTDGGVARFSVPVDNPFVPTTLGGSWNGTWNGVPITDLEKLRMEYWAVGLRHPWRMAFDSVTGQLWTGDVGQNLYEEINLVVRGGNYGWVWREGLTDTNFATNPTRPVNFTSIDPVWAYPHTSVSGANPLFSGNSVVGGVVYRGSRFSALQGHYIFCDSVSGHVWARNPTTGAVSRITGVAGAYGGLVTMSVDPSNQDVLFAHYLEGRILRLSSGTEDAAFPATLSATGYFADLTDLSPAPGLLPYAPILSFWSDHALKQRWFTIPQPSAAFIWRADSNWTYPTGTVWVKHFDLETTRGNPATRKRLETRFLVKTDTGSYGVSYRWNEAQTDATLVPDEGVDFDLPIVENGVSRVQRWSIPSRASCLTCHTPQAGSALSFNTRQLNRTETIHGRSGNQLTLLEQAGYLSNPIGEPTALPRHVHPSETTYSVEARVRSYIDVNCAYCHRADGTVAGAFWDGRAHLTLEATNLRNGPAQNNGGNPANRLIVPGDLTHSIVYNRINPGNGFTRMPPLGSSELDAGGISLMAEWIAALGARPDYAAWRLANFGSDVSLPGEETADPDGDGIDNRAEFISMTDPLNGSSYLRLQLSAQTVPPALEVAFVLPPDRTWHLETSTDLTSWTRWIPPGADGLPRAVATSMAFPAPVPSISAPAQYFRLRLEVP